MPCTWRRTQGRGTYRRTQGYASESCHRASDTRRAPLLLLDEPTSGLDPVAIDEFHAILTALSESGTTVFMVTHDVYGACHVAKRVGLLQQGRMVGMFEAGDGVQISAEEVHQTFSTYHAS